MALRLLLIYLAFVLAFGVVVGTGLITGPGEWYSASMPYRHQTDAFLRGDFAISEMPTALQLDHVWAEGGVHQVWGLGVPAWRLPFEALARIFGQPMFPDRIALALALALFAYVVLTCVTTGGENRTVAGWVDGLKRHPEHLLVAVLLILFPPLITFFRGPFNVYEEAVVYGCIFGMGLFAGLLALRHRPVAGHYLLLCFAAGLVGFVRPTMLAYGLASVVVAFCIARQSGWSWRTGLGGWAAFGAGVILLLMTNGMRYGSPFEFGHQLNLTSPDMVYTSRFEAPFHSESMMAAAKELFGSVFLVPDLNGFAVYEQGVVPLEAQSPRWRHFYHTTFDFSFFVLAAAGWFFGFWKLVTGILRRRRLELKESTIAAAWSIGGILPVAYFYLYFHASSSRYILDFAPGIAAAMAGGFYALNDFPERWKGWRKRFLTTAVAAFAMWWGWQLVSGNHHFPQAVPTSRERISSLLATEAPPYQGLPSEYALEGPSPASSGIYSNGRGWNPDDGRVGAVVYLFVEDLDRLELDLAPASGESPEEEDYRRVRAKVGLEELALESLEETDKGRRLIFSRPERKAYREGLQVVFLAFVPAEDFRTGSSPFVLSRVTWRSE